MIKYLRNYKIDRQLWDSSLEKSHNRLIYASSWYLDIVAPGWEALVSDNYEYIMPLPAKIKYGISYLIQPKFVQQLGIYSVNPISQEITKAFLKKIPSKFLWKHFYFNSNVDVNDISGFSPRTNYELDLSAEYEPIKNDYCTNTSRNITKAIKAGISIETTNDFCGFHELYRQYSKLKPSETSVLYLQRIIEEGLKRRTVKIVLARNINKEIISGALFLKSWDRIIYICSFSTEEGYNVSALFLLIDKTIKMASIQYKIFDFEGSMQPGIARFFAGFGAKPINYYEYKFSIETPIKQIFKHLQTNVMNKPILLAAIPKKS